MRTKTTKSSVRRLPWNGATDKGLERFLPTAVQKSYFMISDAERVVLNAALEKYQPGQSEPVYVGSGNVLKPALRFMTSYRLAIEEIKDSHAITSYTRWVDAVQLKGADEKEVYLTFSPRFEHIWLALEGEPPELCWQETGPHWTPQPVRSSDVQLGEKRSLGWHQAYFVGGASHGAGDGFAKGC